MATIRNNITSIPKCKFINENKVLHLKLIIISNCNTPYFYSMNSFKRPLVNGFLAISILFYFTIYLDVDSLPEPEQPQVLLLEL